MKNNGHKLVDLEKVRKADSRTAQMMKMLEGVIDHLHSDDVESFAICLQLSDPDTGRGNESLYWVRSGDLRSLVGSVEELKARLIAAILDGE
jgi:hypothetical protein